MNNEKKVRNYYTKRRLAKSRNNLSNFVIFKSMLLFSVLTFL